MSVNIKKEVELFNDAELVLLKKLGMRLRKGKVKVEKTKEELLLIEKAKKLGYVGKGGGDGSKKRINNGVGNFVRGLMFKDEKMSNKDILELVNKEYGNENTTLSCISWYKNDVIKNWKKGVKGFERVKV
jgi:hypothetical protein